ncbi:zinc ribbon domain-containing protein [Porphyromonadaceae bacterium OttesenSCG-928-L07]|nr:zinc ribbon domain-containing protein [Porphyromonadaceae bacterium OttesenSCG-928-L07]MDL2251959.1 zinc ribbon domain-containing protein [Odoribacter sp. OttesenSCG-928-J03]MDL2283291.1 zinc ribbon domain-containing protein [Odoribacter sp. OttesenSCG-928-G04]
MECPRCKEDMPLLSKICPVCGYTEDGGENNVSADEFADSLEACLHDIKMIPEPTFLRSMEQLTFVMYPIIAVYLLIVALMSEAGLFWLLFGLFLLLSIVALVRKSKGVLGNDPFNKEFKEIKNAYEYNERLAKRSFGKNREVSTLLTEISSQIAAIEIHRKNVAKKNLLIWAVILVVFFALASGGVFSVNKSLSEKEVGNALESVSSAVKKTTESAKKIDFKKAVEEFKKSANDDDKVRLNMINLALAKEEIRTAVELFTDYCMGKVGDYACAEAIVRHYIAKSDKEAAEKFVESCKNLRYKSDIKKLKKLLN